MKSKHKPNVFLISKEVSVYPQIILILMSHILKTDYISLELRSIVFDCKNPVFSAFILNNEIHGFL